MNDGDLIVGSSIEIPANHKLVFYNNSYNVVARLDETGTGLDTAVYANMNTIREMLESSTKQGFRYYDGDPERAISSVMIKVADGYGIENVTNDINVHVRKVEATQAKSMVSSIAGGLTNVSRVITALVAAIWVLALELLERVGIAALRDAYPNELSGGELRRLAIARALLRKPAVMLADEPTSNLDDENTHAVLHLLRQYADEGAASQQRSRALVFCMTRNPEKKAYHHPVPTISQRQPSGTRWT